MRTCSHPTTILILHRHAHQRRTVIKIPSPSKHIRSSQQSMRCSSWSMYTPTTINSGNKVFIPKSNRQLIRIQPTRKESGIEAHNMQQLMYCCWCYRLKQTISMWILLIYQSICIIFNPTYNRPTHLESTIRVCWCWISEIFTTFTCSTICFISVGCICDIYMQIWCWYSEDLIVARSVVIDTHCWRPYQIHRIYFDSITQKSKCYGQCLRDKCKISSSCTRCAIQTSDDCIETTSICSEADGVASDC